MVPCRWRIRGFRNGRGGAPPDLNGLQSADSVAVDPHKWLYAPLEAGCALVRNPAALRNAFSYHPPYYNFEAEGRTTSTSALRTRVDFAHSRSGSRCSTREQQVTAR